MLRAMTPRPDTSGKSGGAGPRAVQYLRMSTEHQRYSFENQAAVISAYALDRGLELIRTYSDAGKSGLTLSGRNLRLRSPASFLQW